MQADGLKGVRRKQVRPVYELIENDSVLRDFEIATFSPPAEPFSGVHQIRGLRFFRLVSAGIPLIIGRISDLLKF